MADHNHMPAPSPARLRPRVDRWWLLAAVCVVLLAYLLRVFHLDTQSIWFDEGWSWHLAGMPLGQMARVTADDRSPFLYYALLHGWIALTGDSEFAMRFLSVCADTVTAALAIALSRALGGRLRLVWLAGLLYAVAPFAVWYAQETRMYALVATFCAASSYWLWRWLNAPGRLRYLVASALLLAGAAYQHYYAIFLLPAQGLAVLLYLLAQTCSARASGVISSWRERYAEARRRFIRWFVAALLVAASLIPWLIYASVGFAYDDGFVFPLNTVSGRLGEWIAAFANGGLARTPEAWWPAALLVAVIAAVASYAISGRRQSVLFLAALITGSLLAAAVAVRVVYPYRSVFHPRYLIYTVPLAVVLLAGVPQVPAPRLRWLAAALALVAAVSMAVLWLPPLYANYFDQAVYRDDVRLSTRHVVEALLPGDVVVMTRDNYAVRYYLKRSYPQQIPRFLAMPAGLHGVLSSDSALLDTLNALAPQRVRLFLWQDAVVDPQRLVESTLWANGYEMGEIDFGQIRLPLYRVQALPLRAPAFQPADAIFGGQLALTGYWLRGQGQPGNWFYTLLVWKPLQKLAVNYKVFVHVLDAAGHIVFQRDKLPLSDLVPMSSWVPGEPVRDSYAMVIPANLPAGEYRVAVGVYGPSGAEPRLPVVSSSQTVADRSIILGTLQVRKR